MMGGDFGPEVTVKGLSHALDQLDNVHANLFGNEHEIRNALDKYPSLNKKLDIIHTENFVLIDKDRRIRGIYDGTKKENMQKIIADITTLKEEYK